MKKNFEFNTSADNFLEALGVRLDFDTLAQIHDDMHNYIDKHGSFWGLSKYLKSADFSKYDLDLNSPGIAFLIGSIWGHIKTEENDKEELDLPQEISLVGKVNPKTTKKVSIDLDLETGEATLKDSAGKTLEKAGIRKIGIDPLNIIKKPKEHRS